MIIIEMIMRWSAFATMFLMGACVRPDSDTPRIARASEVNQTNPIQSVLDLAVIMVESQPDNPAISLKDAPKSLSEASR